MLASACSPLLTFNALVPKDGGSRLVAHDVAYGGDPRQQLDLYAPVKPAGALPVIVFFYGGSWNSGTRRGYAFVGRALAAQGFLVAVPDYRLVPAVQYPAFLDDCAAATRWVRANARRYGGDGDRMVLAGHSAGAYNAAMLALDPKWLGDDRAAVRGLVGLAGPYDFLPLEPGVALDTFGKVADPASTQPIGYVSRDDPPAFIAWGTKDTTVRPSNSEHLAARLAAAGVRVEAHPYPGVTHVAIVTSLAKPFRGHAPVLADLAAFARSVTAPRQP
jgi:acetyl esterase/lipase